MKILQIDYLIREGDFGNSEKLDQIVNEIKTAIYSIHWPKDNATFTLYPQKKGNGVVPIKKSFLNYLSRHEWLLEHRMAIASRQRPGAVDAVKVLPDGRSFAVEWETGNISSSHRALNKMAVGLLDGILAGGILVLPSRDMYQYLTDRVGNYAEIKPYFPVWRNLKIKEGVLAIIEIEYDSLSLDVPPIRKGTDGRALR